MMRHSPIYDDDTPITCLLSSGLTGDSTTSRRRFSKRPRCALEPVGQRTLANLDELDRRFAALNDLTSKGVHTNVLADEVGHAVVQPYLLIGDLIRLAEPARAGDSSSGAEVAPDARDGGTE